MVTGLLLGLQVSEGLCPDRNEKTVISRKKFTIWHICTIKCMDILWIIGPQLMITMRLTNYMYKRGEHGANRVCTLKIYSGLSLTLNPIPKP